MWRNVQRLWPLPLGINFAHHLLWVGFKAPRCMHLSHGGVHSIPAPPRSAEPSSPVLGAKSSRGALLSFCSSKTASSAYSPFKQTTCLLGKSQHLGNTNPASDPNPTFSAQMSQSHLRVGRGRRGTVRASSPLTICTFRRAELHEVRLQPQRRAAATGGNPVLLLEGTVCWRASRRTAPRWALFHQGERRPLAEG